MAALQMSQRNALKEIAESLAGIANEDLTHAERQVVDILGRVGFRCYCHGLYFEKCPDRKVMSRERSQNL